MVPFEMLPTNHMLVEARINDKGPYHLIFDLGSPLRFWVIASARRQAS